MPYISDTLYETLHYFNDSMYTLISKLQKRLHNEDIFYGKMPLQMKKEN